MVFLCSRGMVNIAIRPTDVAVSSVSFDSVILVQCNFSVFCLSNLQLVCDSGCFIAGGLANRVL